MKQVAWRAAPAALEHTDWVFSTVTQGSDSIEPGSSGRFYALAPGYYVVIFNNGTYVPAAVPPSHSYCAI
jgi:hypothetical protein